ncbi:Pro-Pol polyprotein [Labeo rohita]|uniref:Pro-Pol polyprotein n=1 Tax=Labeo rohita TaxID=84645 RepID=A0ABQ8MVX4_LABRO|nr:Pro-Pol polyprotein [Labeo rohita]
MLLGNAAQERLNEIINGLEEILTAGGFALKPWLRDEDNKALGTGYLVEDDKLYIMASINFSKRKKKMRTGQNLLRSEVRLKTPNPLTRRHLLSQVAGLYDPTGLVTPAKQKGAILVRKAFQGTGSGSLTQQTWDKELSENLKEESIKLFEEYAQLSQVKFHRSLTPVGWEGKPWGITFSDGSDKSYGAVLYLRWNTDQWVEVRLVESKAKLTPLDQKGDAVKAEICGAVFAVCLRRCFEKHGRMEVERWFHLVDSQTVLGAIQRDSYGYQTFFANRIGEIQKSGPVNDWWWIPGDVNIADIITRGGTPENLGEESEWQKGPQFLRLPVEEWPMKSADEVAVDARERVSKLQRKTFSAVLTRAQAKKDLGEMVKESLKESSPRCRNQNPKNGKRDLVPKDETKPTVLTVKEQEDALRGLFLAAQEGVTFPDTTLSRLAIYREDSGLCGGRIQIFNEEKVAVPILPYKAWVSTLLAHEAHNANHKEVAGTLLRIRIKAWVIKDRRLAKKIVDSCVICRTVRARRCQQIMGDLPPESARPAAPFEFTTLDLFGPYEVKDEVRKRV